MNPSEIEWGRWEPSRAQQALNLDPIILAVLVVMTTVFVASSVRWGWRRDAWWKPALLLYATLGIYSALKTLDIGTASKTTTPFLLLMYASYGLARAVKSVRQ